MAAAFELTRPEHGGRYQVTVYQLGWRLGGKGASGRGPAGRIEEHGLHLWMGFYENAFRLVRECYAELGRDPRACPIATWRDAFAANARQQIDARAAEDVELRRLWTIVDLTLATLRGIVRFHLPTDPRGFDAIEDYDCREWLLMNGASEQSVNSGYLRCLYDLGFSYEDGDTARPRIAAGQALRSMVRAFFTYRGSFFWRMQAGMGDVVFAPFYEVLRRRGVRFAFFHRLENVRLGRGEPPYVEALEFDVQADVHGAEYRPLVDVGGLPCWPSAPDWLQLVGGHRLARECWDFESFWDRRRARTLTLRVGDDFDLVVLGVGLGAIPHVCRDLVARDPRWRAMVERVKTVATQAFQVWMQPDMAELGWPGPAITVSGFVEPFDTWADMRHLIPRERWARPPCALAY